MSATLTTSVLPMSTPDSASSVPTDTNTNQPQCHLQSLDGNVKTAVIVMGTTIAILLLVILFMSWCKGADNKKSNKRSTEAMPIRRKN